MQLLRRHLMGLNIDDKKLVVAALLGTLAFCAFFFAQGTMSLLATTLFPLNSEVASVDGTKSSNVTMAPGSKIPDVKEILKRNIFDSTTGPLWPPPTDGLDTTAPEPEDEVFLPDPNSPPPHCEGTTVKLIASIYSETVPDWSFASLSAGSGSPLLYRIGGVVDNNKVLAIYPKAVYLKPSSGKPCSILMFGEQVTATAKPDANASASAAQEASYSEGGPNSLGGISNEELDQNITKISDTKYTITRSLIDKVLINQAALMRSARVVPHEQNGQVEGVKLYGIRRNSLLGKLGLQNGDLLRSINGFDMSRPDSALEAYTRLRSADNLALSVQRRKQDMNISYSIQ
jgi:general secretion pathway protein C